MYISGRGSDSLASKTLYPCSVGCFWRLGGTAWVQTQPLTYHEQKLISYRAGAVLSCLCLSAGYRTLETQVSNVAATKPTTSQAHP